MPLNEYQRANFKQHIHSTEQIIDPETGEVAEGGGGSAADTTFSPTGGIAATNVQAAIAELDTEKATAAALTSGLAGKADTAHTAHASLLLDEISAPSTPASGKAAIYVKSDGRVYSKGDDGVERGPFDVAGADLTAGRLSGVGDTDSLPIGTYGDNFEYPTRAAFNAVWTKIGIDQPQLGFSHCTLDCLNQPGYGIYRGGLTLPNDFEVAALINPPAYGMPGIGVGNGTSSILSVNYGPNYIMRGGASFGYTGTLTSSGTPDTYQPTWFALKRSGGTTWRARFSADGATWSGGATAGGESVSGADRIWVGVAWNNGARIINVHKLIYGVPDLGFG